MKDSSRLASIIVCTHNRALLLDHCLESISKQTVQASEFEVIVVDNGSKDETLKVSMKWSEQTPNLRYIFEPRLGLSISRNTGVNNVETPFVIFLDDDCTVQPQWLEAYLQAFKANPTGQCFGGRIWLDWEGGKAPGWMPTELWAALGHLDYGNEEMAIKHANGGNMAWKRQTLIDLGGFPEQAGRVGRKLLAGEEGMLQLQLRERGDTSYYVPQAIAFHWVPVGRQTLRHHLVLFFYYGISSSLNRRSCISLTSWDSVRLMARESLNFGIAIADLARRCWLKRSVSFVHGAILMLTRTAQLFGFLQSEARFIV